METTDKLTKNRFLHLIGILMLTFTLAIVGTGVFSAFASFIIPEETQPFTSKKHEYTWTDDESNEHTEEVSFDCYPISGTNTSIAVAWHVEGTPGIEYDTPDHLEIPATLKDANDAIYDVVAIYKGGFSRCDFSTISVPNAVQEIGEEAFAYCLKLTEFALPYNCTEIAPSTFMDCRSLETFWFRTNEGATTKANSRVTSVGDHAFLNCIKLSGFSCPTSLINVGDSAFQNCKKITVIFFPKTTYSNPADVPVNNRIHVGNYAFAECDALTMFYFDVNMWSFGEYVFAKCNLQKLNLNYTGDTDNFEDPEQMGEWSRSENETHNGIDSHWRDHYTALGNTERFNFIGGRGKFDYDPTDQYPGLYFTIDDDIRNLMLDQSTLQTGNKSWQAKIYRILGNNSISGTVDKIIDKNEAPTDFKDRNGNPVYKYATIIQFEPPEITSFSSETSEPYYNSETGALRIPDQVVASDGNAYPVRVIDSNVFKDKDVITSVKFGRSLVQIRHHSFLGCDNINNLDFSACEDLLEISYEVFHDKGTYNTNNTKLQTLNLPDCLKYIGASAFLNFTNVSAFHLSVNTVFIAQSAFENLGSNISVSGTVDLVLPNTLRDGPVDENAPAYGFKIFRYTGSSLWDECIQKEAFKGAKCIRSIQMQPIPTTSDLWKKVATNIGKPNEGPQQHDTIKPYRMGIQVNAFENCTSLVRFEANKLLYVIGQEAFKGCTSLKELFLSTFGSKVTKWQNSIAWGFNGGDIDKGNENSIFGTTSIFTDLVIYIDDPAGAPRGNTTVPNKTKWNSVAATYPNQFSTSSIALVPTYNGVVRDEVKYYNLSSTNSPTPYEDSTDFTSPSIAFIKKTDYTITRCYCGNSDISEIDMSNFNESSNIKTIGSGAFGQMEGNLPGRKIILPDSLTEISDRAFYRACNNETNNRGVQIVTYKEEGVEQAIEGKNCYCILPDSVTKIGRLAFYNNCFESIQINGDLEYLGNTAFGVFPFEGSSATSRAQIDSITLGSTESPFEVSSANGGLYYKDKAQKTLIYQPASFNDGNSETPDDVLRIDDTALAVGARACANTTYSSVTIPNSVTTIYGGAFNRCLSMTSVSFGDNPGLKYIGAKAYSPDSELWSGETCNKASTMNDTPGSTDITHSDYHGAFYKSGITDFDFTQLNGSLIKIGPGAFEECKNLVNMVGTKKYSYYKWEGSEVKSKEVTYNVELPSPEKSQISNTILDLSGCNNLRAIGLKAFKNCTSIKYVHLPNNYDPANNKALYLGSGEPESGRTIDQNNDESVFQGLTSSKIFVGEKSATANIAHDTDNNQSRYPLKTFDNNKKAYYFAESESDLYTGGDGSYWYQLNNAFDGTKRIVYFETKNHAINFFRSSNYRSL